MLNDDSLDHPHPSLTAREREFLEELMENCALVARRADGVMYLGRDTLYRNQHISNKVALSLATGKLLKAVKAALFAGVIDGKVAGLAREEVAK